MTHMRKCVISHFAAQHPTVPPTLLTPEREMRMAMRIRVTMRADLYEKRKQEHIERGYRIEDERPIPVNGLCSFIAVRESTGSDALTELVTQALNGNHGVREN
jgi:hypothetical protein